MLGYKGIQYSNGILRAKVSFGKTGDIFEVGVPKQKVQIYDDRRFTENGYSFCRKIEDVLNWENYCELLKNRIGGVDSRLFLIDTLDSRVIGGSDHYKAEQIVVLREITHDEIVQYFTAHPMLRGRISEEQWGKFCDDKFEEYKLIIDADEINKTLVKNCLGLGQVTFCKQDSQDYELSKCIGCGIKTIRGNTFYDLTDYYYLHARRKLYIGVPLEDIEEYQELEGCKVEQDNLRLLARWLHNNK